MATSTGKRAYSDEFKKQRLEELALGLSVVEVSGKNGIAINTLRRWLKMEREEASEAAKKPLPSQNDQEPRKNFKAQKMTLPNFEAISPSPSPSPSTPAASTPFQVAPTSRENVAQIRDQADKAQAECVRLRHQCERFRQEIINLKAVVAALSRVVTG